MIRRTLTVAAAAVLASTLLGAAPAEAASRPAPIGPCCKQITLPPRPAFVPVLPTVHPNMGAKPRPHSIARDRAAFAWVVWARHYRG